VRFLPEPDLAGLPGELPRALAGGRFSAVACPAPLYSLRELFAFRGAARAHGLDLLHYPHYVCGAGPGCPVVVTLHDAIHLAFPPSRAAWLYARVMMAWAARSAATLLTVSNASRDELARRLGVDAGRFVVTPNGIGPPFAVPSPEAVRRFRAERHLERPFVLCVASHRPHKNLPAAVAGFRRARLDGARLVVPARDADAARALAGLCPEGPDLLLLRGVADGDLPLLYAAARITLVPSRLEGFGLPGLEALACGGVVLATDIAAHREVLGDAARFAPGTGADAIAAALRDLWTDGEARGRLAGRGPERAAAFRWETTARLTLDAYRAAALGAGRSRRPLL
jgi:glycosyltransferase involved in cell wall biosynthesis